MGQLSVKSESQNAPLASRDFRRSNKQKLSANIAISYYSPTHLYQSILPVLACGGKLISCSQLFSSSDTRRFLGIALQGIKKFQRVNLFNNLFFDMGRVAGIRKKF